ncbi:MAG TPA: hypothetical protein DHV31_03070 [Clostridiales bacterium]|nr:hypothetical protein [Clostridiales bacterium]
MKKWLKILLILTMLAVLSVFCISCFEIVKYDEEKTASSDPILGERFDLTNQVLQLIQDLYYDDPDYDLADLYAAYGLVTSLGDYNYMYSVEDLLSSTVSDGKGFGLLIRSTVYNERLVDFILPGSPFLTASDGQLVQRGDEIYSINDMRVSGLDSNSYSLILSMLPSDEPCVFTMKRGEETFTVTYSKVDVIFPQCIYINDLPGVPSNFGYIYLRSFDGNSAVLNEFTSAVASFNQDGNSALILDLRGNGGGSSLVFQQIASCLIGNTPIGEPLLEIDYAKKYPVSLIRSVSVAQKVQAEHIYVLCDNHTASASEALIGTMKAHGTLTSLIGLNTVGKGVAQNGVNLLGGDGYLMDKGLNEEGEEIDLGPYIVQVIVGKYYIYDSSADGGKYCMHGQPFEPDVKITGSNVISSDYSEDLYIAAAILDYQSR